MSRLFMTVLMLFMALTNFAQTILSGSEIFGKERKEGFYMTLSIDKKYIEKDWAIYISKYGGVSQNREIFSIASANMSEISPDPINLMSKVISEQKLKTKVFASFDVGGGQMVSENSINFSKVEKFLKDFYAFAMQNEDVRLAERDSEEAQKSLERVNKTGDKISRDIERNKREKEKLLKAIEENRIELEKLLNDQIANKQDQENAKISLEEKQKAASLVKTKKNN
ncbi:hypothetical protein Emtol_3793 [Emticicia oligotrophica DSM 17448]|uniref:DUF4468 domain-containing protein n=1 Tax=Emticicia oligotrophica (strain DSM 17448 / CIP 109782 / MTCC 6937 / GPTSA100-15) TaxID=929562 RepID=A0ABN4AR47_EMTOG|nr:hypothetical protein [Emticicia oligotrophica]AFK04919.1 hypothetical protein Emtol_3793 [Emticicia oligotrophica DSM 17448]